MFTPCKEHTELNNSKRVKGESMFEYARRINLVDETVRDCDECRENTRLALREYAIRYAEREARKDRRRKKV